MPCEYNRIPSRDHVDLVDRYAEVISVIRQVHHQYLNLIRAQLDQIGVKDINSVQAIILLNIGDATIAIHELRTRGNYLGANVSYIIKRLVGNGYLIQQCSSNDLRTSDIWLSDKGRALCDRLTEVHEHFNTEGRHESGSAVWTLRQLEQFWIDLQLEDRLGH